MPYYRTSWFKKSRPKKRRSTVKSEHLGFLIERDGNWCVYCSRPDPDTVDHVVPLRAGGSNQLDNLVASCYECNQDKGGYGLLMWLGREKNTRNLEQMILAGKSDEEIYHYKFMLGPSRFKRIISNWGIDTLPFFHEKSPLVIKNG